MGSINCIINASFNLIATPAMLGLKGDFKVEDFLDDESDFAAGVFLVNERFAEEGEPQKSLKEMSLILMLYLQLAIEI